MVSDRKAMPSVKILHSRNAMGYVAGRTDGERERKKGSLQAYSVLTYN
jgi:hypothetical protein